MVHTPSTPTGRMSAQKMPKFLHSLCEILNSKNSVLTWAQQGTAIQIHNLVELSEKILPMYFNHRNYKSFQRQLNYFGFRKWTKTQTKTCMFSHPEFTRDYINVEAMIFRKRCKKSGKRGVDEMKGEKVMDSQCISPTLKKAKKMRNLATSTVRNDLQLNSYTLGADKRSEAVHQNLFLSDFPTSKAWKSFTDEELFELSNVLDSKCASQGGSFPFVPPRDFSLPLMSTTNLNTPLNSLVPLEIDSLLSEPINFEPAVQRHSESSQHMTMSFDSASFYRL